MTPAVETFIHIKHSVWETEIPGVEALCQQAAAAAWAAGFSEAGNFEASVVLADNDFVQALNRDYRQQDKPTNVLSFPTDEAARNLPDDIPSLGDIVIAFETTKEEAPENIQDHLTHLVVHGCLHVLGYDHEEEKEALEMEQLETKILAGLGIADPYA